jgi:hypothetical protein
MTDEVTRYFIRLRDGAVIEKGWTDAAAFEAMQAQSDEYVPLAKEQHDIIMLGDPAPEG